MSRACPGAPARYHPPRRAAGLNVAWLRGEPGDSPAQVTIVAADIVHCEAAA
jgi:hypothetical protein